TPGSPGYVSAASHGAAHVLATATGNSFIVTFGGTLASPVSAPLLAAGNFVGNANASVSAANGATTAVTLVSQGGAANVTPTQWFGVGPAPVNLGQVF